MVELEEDSEEEDEDVPVYCICRKPEEGFMICCEVCNEWFHGHCIGIEREMGERLPKYICHTCNNGTRVRQAGWRVSHPLPSFPPSF